MSTASILRPDEPETAPGDVLDAMTRAHSDLLARHGRLNRELAPMPLSPVEFDGQRARAGVALEQAPSSERVAHTMAIEAARHEQIGRLATYVAAYETAYGDANDAPSLRELARDHLGLAKDLREQLAMDQAMQEKARLHQDVSDYVSTKTNVRVSAEQDAASRPPRGNGNEL